jgi:hypothetical protein
LFPVAFSITRSTWIQLQKRGRSVRLLSRNQCDPERQSCAGSSRSSAGALGALVGVARSGVNLPILRVSTPLWTLLGADFALILVVFFMCRFRSIRARKNSTGRRSAARGLSTIHPLPGHTRGAPSLRVAGVEVVLYLLLRSEDACQIADSGDVTHGEGSAGGEPHNRMELR